MKSIPWMIKGVEFVHCNCNYGCPCQFNALPTHGACRAMAAFRIDEGHHGDTRLDGLKCAIIVRWPGPIHEGNGEVLPIIDERATPPQREALMRILTGEDTEPGATIFQVFSATFSNLHEPVFAAIDVDVDVDDRKARVRIPGLVEARGEPILNPVTGAEHRARIQLPQGFEYDVCEVGRGWTETQEPLKLSLSDTHAQFARLQMTGSGVAHGAGMP